MAVLYLTLLEMAPMPMLQFDKEKSSCHLFSNIIPAGRLRSMLEVAPTLIATPMTANRFSQAALVAAAVSF